MWPVVRSDGTLKQIKHMEKLKMNKQIETLVKNFNALSDADKKAFRDAIRSGRQSGEWDLSASPVGISKSKSGSSWVILPYDAKLHRTKITDFAQLMKTLAKGCALLPLYSGNRDKTVATDLASAQRLIVSRYENRDYGARLPFLTATAGRVEAAKPASDIPDSL